MTNKNKKIEPDKNAFCSKAVSIRRRVIFFGLVILINLFSVLWLADLFWGMGFQKAHLPLLAIFFLLNGLLTLGSMHAIFGFFDIIGRKKHKVLISDVAKGLTGELKYKHAVVMPVYNEDCEKVCARIEAIYESIKKEGHFNAYHFYIISDTRDLDLWVKEEMAWTNMCRRLDGYGHIFYRRRKENTNRKAGNIADFVRTWGGHYETMTVLDADSLMEGKDIVNMTRVMEEYPQLGILQTAPKLIRGNSVFTRLQQFAMRLYGPLFIRGLNFWQLGGGSYWGHNALIRLKPFSEYCELPDLPGKEPFGGRVLSHDFVEAALMVSQGWEVWLAWDIEGTYEEAPPTLVDHLVRDRRWCQGNLQHMWLIFASNMKFTVRVHLFMGIMAYLGSPLWLLFLICSTWIAWDRFDSELSYLPFEDYAERVFGISENEQSLLLMLIVMSLLFLPKILSVLCALFNSATRKAFGGGIHIIVGALIETSISILLAPCIMIAHTMIVLSICLGRAVGWGNQNRETDGTPWRAAFRCHVITTVLGIIWALLAWSISKIFALWMSPILLGMMFSIPVSVWTSRSKYGDWLLKHKILATPEELNPSPVIKYADHAKASIDPALDVNNSNRYGMIAAIVDPYVNAVHLSLLDYVEMTEELKTIAERFLRMGTKDLTKSELTKVFYSATALQHIHRTVWLGSNDGIHDMWIDAVDSYRRDDRPY